MTSTTPTPKKDLESRRAPDLSLTAILGDQVGYPEAYLILGAC